MLHTPLRRIGPDQAQPREDNSLPSERERTLRAPAPWRISAVRSAVPQHWGPSLPHTPTLAPCRECPCPPYLADLKSKEVTIPGGHGSSRRAMAGAWRRR